MRSITLLLFFVLSSLISAAQQYGIEWIKYDQKYFKFPVTEDGIYRINYNTIAAAGLFEINPRNLALYGRGIEIPIYIAGESDGIFNTGDFIEFYAERNDGWLDSNLYEGGASKQANPYYSLINDTATYFLTYNNSFNNKRLKVETDINYSAYPASPFFWKEAVQFFNSDYYPKDPTEDDPSYSEGDGWADAWFDLGASQTKTLETKNVYTSGPSAILSTAVVGASKNNHRLTIEYSSNNSSVSTLADVSFYGYRLNKFNNLIIPSSQLGSISTDITFSSISPGTITTGRTAVNHLKLKYPHTYDLEGKIAFTLYIPSSTTKLDLPITNFNFTTTLFYDLTNGLRIPAAVSGSSLHVVLPASATERKCFVISETELKTVNSLKPVSPSGYFKDYTSLNNINKNYIIVTSPELDVQEYAAYRSSEEGGSHSVLVVNINELYDQYAYGIKKHPLAIKQFLRQAIDSWSVKPENLFIIGKGIHAIHFRKVSADYSRCIVPSFGGYYSSDNLFTAGLDGNLYSPAIPTGRLAAKNTDEVLLYLQKVRDQESNFEVSSQSQTLENREWTKRILHFGGGKDTYEQSILRNYLSSYESILEDSSFGGKVHTFLKTTSAPIQITTSDSIKNLINDGVSIMTFFGHASGSGFDQSIQEPADYKNYKKYPLIVANSCLVGDIHMAPGTGWSGGGTSERFIFAPDRGSIAFLAQVGFGYPNFLYTYTSSFFQHLSRNSYGKSIGYCIKQAVQDVQQPNNELLKMTCLEMTLHGDPALVINAHAKPDIIIEPQEVSFNPSVVTEEADSFKVNINLKNIGKGTNQTFRLEVIRTFPGGDTLQRAVAVNGVNYNKTITFTFPVDHIKGIGLNTFQIYADAGNLLEELSETNNKISLPLLITSSSLTPVFPYKYAIVPKDTITLKATTSDPFAVSRNYIFEIDTTDYFNSAFKKYQIVNHSGGIVPAFYKDWKNSVSGFDSPLILNDSTVYFWRVTPDTSATQEKAKWRESSFQYIKDKKGWEQAHFHQFKNDGYKFISYKRNSTSGTFDFIPNQKGLYCQTYGMPTMVELFGTEYRLDGAIQGSGGCTGVPAMVVAVIDSLTLEPWNTEDFNFGNVNTPNTCRKTIDNYFIFWTTDAAQLKGLKTMLDSVPKGAYILMYSFIQGNFQNWADTSPFASMSALGATKFSTLPSANPYIFFAKKGDLSSAVEKFSIQADTMLTFETTLKNSRTYGEIVSEVVGPAKEWNKLYWAHRSQESNSQDSVSLNIIGINSQGQEITLGAIPATATAVDIDTINASTYPYLKLKLHLSDPINQTPAQLKKWQILYAGVPEATVNPSRYFSIQSSSAQEGEEIKFKIAVENISDENMDSLLVTYQVQDKTRRMRPLLTKRLRALPAGDTLISSVTIPTLGLTGNNTLWLEINPMNSLTGKYDQLEQYHFNNFSQTPFTVSGDKKNPLLDVTFDGAHIMDGDIVSAKPEILIQLRDENRYIAMDTSSVFKVFIKEPGEQIENLLLIDNKVLKFIPASLPDNKCKIQYNPEFKKDGLYELRVQAKDLSNNRSGDIDYRINFEVINKSTITNILNYPNPFSTSTRFAFTLTGSEMPSSFKIQILTVTGKVVREINQVELGQIRIGRNLTEYAWDGKDEFGDQLANGIYLYKVFCTINGNSIERRETAADSYFVKGFGKMYLLR